MNISPGTDIQSIMNLYPQGTSFCIKAGVHYPTRHVVPKSGVTLTGEYGAIIDGSKLVPQNTIDDAIIWGSQTNAGGVTIRNLVVRNLPGGHYSCVTAWNAPAPGWVIDHNEMSGCQFGVTVGNYSTISHNYIHDNLQYGFAGFRQHDVVFRQNEVARSASCGCFGIGEGGGGTKLVQTSNFQVIGNYFHDNWNHDLHFDTGNSGVLIDGNSFVNSSNTPIAMETNTGTAIIRNNTLVVSSKASDGIVVSNSSNEQIYNNTLSFSGYSIGIRLWFDSSRINPNTNLPYDTANNSVHDNTVILQGSARYAAGINCTAGTNCSPYWSSKGNSFQRNSYGVPAGGSSWVLQSSVSWTQWNGVGFS